jgi:hypothetical protein
MVEVSLNLSSNKESNIFLRALWAEFRSSFGKCAWQYSPCKDGKSNRIYFGYVDLGGSSSVRVSVSYKKKGTIEKLFIEDVWRENLQEFKLALSSAIERAIDTINHPIIFYIQTFFESRSDPLGNYSGNSFMLYSVEENANCIICKVEGFDVVDALTESRKTVMKILDFLAVCTNSSFTFLEAQLYEGSGNRNVKEIFFEDFEWIDDYPRIGNYLSLWENQKKFIDGVASGEIELDHPFLRASSHFHTAQKIWISDPSIVGRMTELSCVLYVSALEVATEIEIDGSKISTCTECSQTKYSIRQRVKNLTRNHLNEHIERFIDGYYAARSKYLHVGILSSDFSYAGSSIPQLDPNSTSGCRIQVSILPINLSEFVSYILRSVFRQKVSSKYE